MSYPKRKTALLFAAVIILIAVLPVQAAESTKFYKDYPSVPDFGAYTDATLLDITFSNSVTEFQTTVQAAEYSYFDIGLSASELSGVKQLTQDYYKTLISCGFTLRETDGEGSNIFCGNDLYIITCESSDADSFSFELHIEGSDGCEASRLKFFDMNSFASNLPCDLGDYAGLCSRSVTLNGGASDSVAFSYYLTDISDYSYDRALELIPEYIGYLGRGYGFTDDSKNNDNAEGWYRFTGNGVSIAIFFEKEKNDSVWVSIEKINASLTDNSELISNFSKSKSYKRWTFTDDSENAWYTDNLKAAFELGLMKGSTDGKFNPDGDITLIETIALAARVHRIYYSGTDDFVQGSPWYKVYTDYAVANGIIKDGEFTDLSANATREQFAYILSKSVPASELKAINTVEKGAIPDVADSKYYDAIYNLYKAGILTGNDAKGTFTPNTCINRSSVAALVTRIVDKSLRKNITLKASGTK